MHAAYRKVLIAPGCWLPLRSPLCQDGTLQQDLHESLMCYYNGSRLIQRF